ncbi:MAG: hypothetical protein IIB81_00615 [Nanoarchaeota archaeon]|nr:hypothetical protein [Nanoarchaeota archaeon]
MKKILLDTNFLMICKQFKVDIFTQIDRISMFKYKLFVLDKSIEELKKIVEGQTGKNKEAAKIALKLISLKNIEIIKNMLPSKIETYGDSNRLKQVFLNMMQNAREAMPNGGAIYLSTNLVHDNSVLIQFRDTGCGISNDQLDKIFCLSYTTKAKGKCAGLGLSVCKTIINELGGSIDIDSKVGVGTVVSLILPKCSVIQKEHSLNVNQP